MNTKHAEDHFCLSVRPHINEEHCFQPISPLIKSDLVSNLVLSDVGLVLQGFSADLITLNKRPPSTLGVGLFGPAGLYEMLIGMWPLSHSMFFKTKVFCVRLII